MNGKSGKTFHIVSLGCDKNTVDSDSMSWLLVRSGYVPVASPGRAHIVIINTCGFISAARKESYDTLDKLSTKKKSGQLLIAAGCLTQRYGYDVIRMVPGIDAILGTRRWMDIVDLVESLEIKTLPNSRYCLSDAPAVGTDERGVPRVSIQGASAYLKIADGCSRTCSYCAIPSIKGPTVSRPVESILAEAVYLQSTGVREVVLIAQNTTDYGRDLGLKNGLASLLREMTSAAPRIDWIRIMYAFPGQVTDALIEVMAERKQIVPYIDMPLQHAHGGILRRMHRPSNIDRVCRTMEKMRKTIPGLAVRSTFIVGFPGETEEEFNCLLEFIEEMRFDRLGAFKFSFEQGTLSEAFGDTVPDEVKEERLKRLMEKQQIISLELNRSFIGRKLDVLIEGKGQGISVGRSSRDAPQVDGLVFVRDEIRAGKMIRVRIDSAMVYDLSGSVSR